MKQSINLLRSRGLTLFELLVVLAILSLLATIVAPRVVGYLGKAKGDVAESQLANLAASLELFYLDFGRYPTENEGLKLLVEKPNELPDWNGPYFKSISGLVDPWGRPYLYSVDNSNIFALTTLGRDGKEAGDGEDEDIVVH